MYCFEKLGIKALQKYFESLNHAKICFDVANIYQLVMSRDVKDW